MNQRDSRVWQDNGDPSYVIGSQCVQLNPVGCPVFDKPNTYLHSYDIEDPWQISISFLVQITPTVAAITIGYDEIAYMAVVLKFVVNGTFPIVNLTHWCQVTHLCGSKLSHQ